LSTDESDTPVLFGSPTLDAVGDGLPALLTALLGKTWRTMLVLGLP
jgi:hypothetical protein